jgi:hypothetical protein
MQNLYARAPIELPGWVTLHARSNFRSPRPVVRMLQSLLEGVMPGAEHIEAASPFDADEVELLVYDAAHPLTQRVKEAIRLCFAAGFRTEDVAIVSWRGRDQSELLRHDRLGANALRSFTGQYDLLGQPEYSAGDVLIESVYRFKGQSAPAVILAEIDFETLDERALRKLFVGATRAMMKLVLVLSERAERQLAGASGRALDDHGRATDVMKDSAPARLSPRRRRRTWVLPLLALALLCGHSRCRCRSAACRSVRRSCGRSSPAVTPAWPEMWC